MSSSTRRGESQRLIKRVDVVLALPNVGLKGTKNDTNPRWSPWIVVRPGPFKKMLREHVGKPTKDGEKPLPDNNPTAPSSAVEAWPDPQSPGDRAKKARTGLLALGSSFGCAFPAVQTASGVLQPSSPITAAGPRRT
jgi:hypothetical protein